MRDAREEIHAQGPPGSRRFMNGRAAASYQGANCGQTADLAYSLLLARGVEGPVSRSSYGPDHEVVLLGDPREKGAANTVLVDAWTHYGMATTVENSHLDSSRLKPKSVHNDSRPNEVAQWALSSNFQTVPTANVNVGMAQKGLPPIGPALVHEIAEGLKEQGLTLYDERTPARDPSTRYTDGHYAPRAYDDVPAQTFVVKKARADAYDQIRQQNPATYNRRTTFG